MTDTTTYEDQAREIGTEHGTNAASWIDLDEETARQIDEDGVFDVLDPSSPLSGEWADGYSTRQFLVDVGIDDDETDDLGTREYPDVFDAYENAYWQAFEYEIERRVVSMRGRE